MSTGRARGIEEARRRFGDRAIGPAAPDAPSTPARPAPAAADEHGQADNPDGLRRPRPDPSQGSGRPGEPLRYPRFHGLHTSDSDPSRGVDEAVRRFGQDAVDRARAGYTRTDQEDR